MSEKRTRKSISKDGEDQQVNENRNVGSKSSIVVALRNKFFFVFYRYSIIIFSLSLIVFLLSIISFVVIYNRPVPPQYVPINEDGTYITLTPVSDCASKNEGDVKKFLVLAANKLYKFDFVNYGDQIQSAAGYFSTQGWNDYLETFDNSKIMQTVKENRQVVTVEPSGIPELVKNAYQNDEGACTWELKYPVTITYFGSSTAIKQQGEIHSRISRVSVLKNPEGLNITRYTFIPKDKK